MAGFRREGTTDAAWAENFLRWLIHPVTVAATALLIVNDHLLKAVFPGWLTGKLSDVAGMVMTPPLLALVLVGAVRLWGWCRPALRRTTGESGLLGEVLAVGAILLVGVGFTVVKATATGAAVASAWWSVVNGPSVIRADLTDLLALPALGLAWWTWRSAAARPTLAGWLRMVAVLVVLPIAGLGVAGTSAPQHDDAIALYEWRGGVVGGNGNAYHGDREPDWWDISPDDGLTFTALKGDDLELFRRQAPPAASGLDCSAREPTHCFRVVPGRLAVQDSRDGGATWRLAWQVDEDARARLGLRMRGLKNPDEYLSSRALLVRDQADDGVVVLVANGRDGYARRDSAGRWERIGFGTTVGDTYRIEASATAIPSVTEATAIAGRRVALPVSAAVGSFVALVGCAALLVRRAGRQRAALVVVAGLMSLTGLVMFVEYALTGTNSGDPLGTVFTLGAASGLSVLPAAALVYAVAVGRMAPGLARRSCLAGLLAGGLIWLPYLLRLLTNWPQQQVLTELVVLLAAGMALLSIPVGIRHSARFLDQPVPATDGGAEQGGG
ncbi:hypothetical protein ACGFIK_01530 [Micromonospora sp. NPDC048871]|uniref:hypothetical protein n=1 Tax=unclassified Micromonospora TaxID=2617518 RepID=UPI002E0D51B1|nr:hypothetical protein OIE53_15320 [Micromonospora sp. NBC_01739]